SASVTIERTSSSVVSTFCVSTTRCSLSTRRSMFHADTSPLTTSSATISARPIVVGLGMNFRIAAVIWILIEGGWHGLSLSEGRGDRPFPDARACHPSTIPNDRECRLERRSRIFEHPLHRVAGQLGACGELEFLFDVFAMSLDRLGTDLQFDGD